MKNKVINIPHKLMSPGYIQTKITDYVLEGKDSFHGSSCHFKSAKFIKENPGNYIVMLLGMEQRNTIYVFHSYVKDRKTKRIVFDCSPEYTNKIAKDKNMVETGFELNNLKQ